MARTEGNPARQLTFTERARRTQLIEVTIALVAEHGYGGTSLSRIAQGAGITKAAVLYHFPTKDAVVRAAYEHVITGMVIRLTAAVEAVEPLQGPGAYIRTMIGYLRDVPEHTRMIVEALTSQSLDQDEDQTARWRALSTILSAAREAKSVPSAADLRTLAIMIGGAIDAIVGERLLDPDYDTVAAAEELVLMTERMLFA